MSGAQFPTTAMLTTALALSAGACTAGPVRPLVHQTDLFHPHGDPDDHFDLATVYALAQRGGVEPVGVLGDWPPAHRDGDPDAIGVAALNWLTGRSVPFQIGTSRPMVNRHDQQSDASPADRGAVNWLLGLLEHAPAPVAITVVGSATDVAVAGRRNPELFRGKCAGIYLNAGAAHPDAQDQLEYNVKLNPAAYSAIFDLPCPLYWAPCWDVVESRRVGPYGAWFSLAQHEVLDVMRPELQNWFLWMLERSTDFKWQRYLRRPVDAAALKRHGTTQRSLWSTASLFTAAGLAVTRDGRLLPAGEVSDPLYEFVPVTVTCADDGRTTWQPATQPTGRFILHLRDEAAYPRAMAAALRELLRGL